MPDDIGRLERIEAKIDQLSEAFISLARTEEKILSVERDREEIGRKLEKQEERLVKIEDKVNAMDSNLTAASGVTAATSKLFWLFVTAIVGALALQWFGQ